LRRAAEAGTDFLRQNSSALGFSGNGEPAHKRSARYSERSGQIEMDAISSFYVLPLRLVADPAIGSPSGVIDRTISAR
jgi:hypothetical protein